MPQIISRFGVQFTYRYLKDGFSIILTNGCTVTLFPKFSRKIWSWKQFNSFFSTSYLLAYKICIRNIAIEPQPLSFKRQFRSFRSNLSIKYKLKWKHRWLWNLSHNFEAVTYRLVKLLIYWLQLTDWVWLTDYLTVLTNWTDRQADQQTDWTDRMDCLTDTDGRNDWLTC